MLVKELRAESARRQGSYKGPGIYKFHTGAEYDVLGVIMRNNTLVILRSSYGALASELLDEFNALIGEVPRYRYLRALED